MVVDDGSDTGGVTIAPGATMDLQLNFIPLPGDSFTIIDNDGDLDAVTGTFAGYADDSSFVVVAFNGAHVPMTIDYNGGDGNDVVLIAENYSTVYVDDSLQLDVDNDSSGDLSAGDEVVVSKIAAPVEGM